MTIHLSAGFPVHRLKDVLQALDRCPTVAAAIRRVARDPTDPAPVVVHGLEIDAAELAAFIARVRRPGDAIIAWARIDEERMPEWLAQVALFEVRAGVGSAGYPGPELSYGERCAACGISSALLPGRPVDWRVPSENRDDGLLFVGGDLLLVSRRLLPAFSGERQRLRPDLERDGFIPLAAPRLEVDRGTLRCSPERCPRCQRPLSIDRAPPGEALPAGGILYDGRQRLRVRRPAGEAGCWVSDVQLGYAEASSPAHERLVFLTAGLVRALLPLMGERLIVHPVDEGRS